MFQLNPENTISVTQGAVVLHNIMRDRFPGQQNADLAELPQLPDGAPGAWRGEDVLPDANRAGERLPKLSKKGHETRTYLRHYYCSEVGSVPWQEAAIERGAVRRRRDTN